MSSADTTLISGSTILSLNVIGPTVGMDREGKLRMTRVFVVVLGGVAWAIASFQQGIIASLLLAYTVFVGGVVFPTLASFWRERLGVTPTAALWAVVVGGGAALLAEFRDGELLRLVVGEVGQKALAASLGPEYSSILPVVLSVVILLLVSRFTRPGPVESGDEERLRK
jgi:Na+/proline symporter